MKFTFLLLLQLNVPFVLSRAVHFGGAAYDLTSTVEVTNGRTIVETNPWLGQSHAQQVAVVGGITFITDWATRKLEPAHPKFATVVNLVAGGIHFLAGQHNLRLRGER